MKYLIWRFRSGEPRFAVIFAMLGVGGGALLVNGLVKGDVQAVARTALMVVVALVWFLAPLVWFVATRHRHDESASRHRAEPCPPWRPH